MNLEKIVLMVLKETLNYYLNQENKKQIENTKNKTTTKTKKQKKTIELNQCPYCKIYYEKGDIHICQKEKF